MKCIGELGYICNLDILWQVGGKMPADQSPVISTAWFSWDRVQHSQRSRHWRLYVGWHHHLSSCPCSAPCCFPLEHLCSWCSSVRTWGTLKHTWWCWKSRNLQIAYSCIIIVWFSALYCSLQRSTEWLLLLLPYPAGFLQDNVRRPWLSTSSFSSLRGICLRPGRGGSFPPLSNRQFADLPAFLPRTLCHFPSKEDDVSANGLLREAAT